MDSLPDSTYKKLLDNAPVLVSLMTEDGVILYESPAIKDVLGYEVGELVAKSVFSLIHPLDLPGVIALIAEGKINRGKRYKTRMRFKRKDETWHWIECEAMYLPEEGEIHGICVYTRSIDGQTEMSDAKNKQQQLYQSVVDVMVDGVVILGQGGVISHCNESACRMLGVTRDQMLGKTAKDPRWQAINEDGSAMLPEAHPSMIALHSGKPVYGVIVGVQKADGSRVWTEVNALPLFEENVTLPSAVVVSFTDITARRDLERSLMKFQKIVEQSPATIVVTNVDGVIEYVNPAFTHVTGYTATEAPGQNPRFLKSGLTNAETYERLWATITNKQVWHGELCNKSKDGSLYWEFATIFPILNEKGEIIHFSAIKENITARKDIEARMEQSEDFLGNIINVAADPIFVKDRQHRWTLLNDSMCAFMGHKREELIGKSDYEFFPKDEADVFWAKDEEVFAKGGENINEESFTDAGGVHHTIVTKKTLYSDSKGNQFIVGVIRDVTRDKQIEAELTTRATELERMNALMIGRELKMVELKNEIKKLTGESPSS